jgi:hypothetical protein
MQEYYFCYFGYGRWACVVGEDGSNDTCMVTLVYPRFIKELFDGILKP